MLKKFIYENYLWRITKNSNNQNLEMSFTYKIDNGTSLSSTLTIKNVSQTMIDSLGKDKVDSYIFNIGLAEMFSYWKSTAAPIIEIRPGLLTGEQLSWWHKLLIKGMGEYFFVNNIKFTDPNFVKIINNPKKNNLIKNKQNSNNKHLNAKTKTNNVLIPIGGGKDSSVTLEIFKNLISNQKGEQDIKNNSIGTFAVNPTQAAKDIISTTGTISATNSITVERTIDQKLIELNKQGYLNGHVPISALFAFISVFAADLFNYDYVAISNERSSNEGSTWFCNREINHQYSKTYEFERDFQEYTKKYLHQDAPFYFSFLRPLYELQIAKIFSGNTSLTSGMKKYHQIFRSCNRGQKTNTWCGKCSKCLFAWVILYPFIENDKIMSYFGKNLFDDLDFWPIAQELLGVGPKKPLECVGTHEETIVAFYLSIKKISSKNLKLPALLEKINNEILSKEDNLEIRTQNILNSWNELNSIPDQFSKILKKYV